MISVPPQEDNVLNLVGTQIASDLSPGVFYQIAQRVGEGGMSIAYVAMRCSPQGQCPVVIKVMRPWAVRQYGETAALVVKKEAVALGRLNERIPPTPFVVRLLDVGNVRVDDSINLPWIALEYVYGGAEGNTLSERVETSISDTGSAFDPMRAAHAIECLTKGLTAVHEVGVVHRDVKPDNVLCCGFGDSEIFKVADFGVARPLGVSGTFGGMGVGTPGYAAPEVIVSDAQNIGPWSDVFSLAAVIFFLLSGEEYFPSRTVAEAILRIQDPRRRSLLDVPTLCPELRGREAACRAIDVALARASAAAPDARPRDVQTVAATILPWLRTDSMRLRPPHSRRLDGIAARPFPRRIPGWSWITRCQSGSDIIIRSVAWDGDGRCLAATNCGLAFWNGDQWLEAPLTGLGDPTRIRMVRRISAGKWLVGCDPANFAIYTADGVSDSVDLDDTSVRIELFSGDLDDLAVVVASRASAYSIHTLVGHRWLKPFPLDDVAAVTSAARIGDARWLIAGRSTRGAGMAAIYEPLRWELTPIPTPPVRAFLAAGGHPDRGIGLVAGADGVVVLHDASNTWVESIDGGADVSAVVVDAVGDCWAAGAGRIWHRDAEPEGQGTWTCAWEDPHSPAPMVSLYADLGLVIGMTADGSIVEGRGISLETGTLLGVPRSLAKLVR